MSKIVKVGVIGAGGIANSVHLPSLTEIENCKVVAICDLYEEKAKNTAEKFHIPKTYISYHEMLAKEELDAVYCLVNPDCMFRVAADCMKAGFPVMMEKPAGLDAYQAQSLERISAQTGKIAAVAMNRRHIPLVQEVIKRVRAVSEIIQIDGRFMKFANIERIWDYGSAFNSDIVHAIDLVRYLAQSEPAKAATVIGRVNCPVDNSWNSVIRFENGIVATLRANYQAGARIHDFEIHGPGASAFINLGFGSAKCEATILYNNGQFIYSAASAGVGGDRKVDTLDGLALAGGEKYYQYYGYKSEDIDFINCLANGGTPLCTITDAAKSMDMVEMMLNGAV